MRTYVIASLLLFLAAPSRAKNLDLVTLPNRDSVQLTIYNSEDITLVKEIRHLTFKRGLNRMQFSWANTLIDPSSVEFRPLEHVDEIELVDTAFPGQKPQHLIWNIQSEHEGQVKVEVTYFTSGLTWIMDYTATTDPEEESMNFRGFVRVYNRSGEHYENAQVRLIVGKINLVEKIATLARQRGLPMPKPGEDRDRRLRRESTRASFAEAEKAAGVGGGAGGRKAIVKEGLSEYFMFTIGGEETVSNGWSKRMRAVEARSPFDIVYRMRSHQYGPRPVRFFLWKNDEEHKLGASPLPDGRVRVFRDNGRDGLSYLGEQLIRYVPVKAEIEVNLGADDLVVYESRRAGTERLGFQFNRHGHVSGWDEKTQWLDVVRNYRPKPIRFELRRVWSGDVEYAANLKTKRFDFQTIETTFTVDARGRRDYAAGVLRHLGSNQKQNRVRLTR